jgi:hypothetical protein
MQSIETKYFDPFADEMEQQEYDGLVVFESLFERYQNEDIEHDFTADKFVEAAETLMLDAHFLARFDEVETISRRMQELCAHDHNMEEAAKGSSIFGSLFTDKDEHGHDQKIDEKKKNKKTKKKSKEAATSQRSLSKGFLGFFLEKV